MFIKTEVIYACAFLVALVLSCALGAIFGYGFADNRCKLEFAEYQNKAEAEYTALLKERVQSAQTYSERVRELETKHAADLQQQKTDYDEVIANMQRDFRPDGVLASSENTSGGDNRGSAVDSARDVVCYTKTELRDKIAQSLVIAAECDKLATDYAALLDLIRVYNDAKKRPVD